MDYLTEREAEILAGRYFESGHKSSSTQEILDSGIVPRLKGYKILPGKVSDSIVGGMFAYHKNGELFEHENSPLNLRDGTPVRLMVRTQRISSHDLNRGEIPFKDQLLTANHDYMRRLAIFWLGTSQFEIPEIGDKSVVIAAENLTQIAFENVIRAYMAKSSTSTSLYQAYVVNGKRTFAGHKLPEGLIVNGILPKPINTPSTKSHEHDETVSPDELYNRGITDQEEYEEIRDASLAAFGYVSSFLRSKGIIMADTKLEHGINRRRRVVVQDETFTLDSSRFWLLDDYEDQLSRLAMGEITELAPKDYSKEFARGFSRGDNEYAPEERIQISVRYMMAVQHLLGKKFYPDLRPRDERVVKGLQSIVKTLSF